MFNFRRSWLLCGAVLVGVVALNGVVNGAVDARSAPVRGAVCVQSGAKAREAVSGRGLVCVRTKTGVLRWRFQPKKTTTTTPATVAPKAYRIGDVGPAGGTVFITPSTVGNSTDLYFEAAPFVSEVRLPWATLVNFPLDVFDASGTVIGAGAANTAAIARQVGNVAGSSAAVYASDYSINGFSDWFLPSKDELNELCKYARTQTTGDTAVPCDNTGSLRTGFSAVNYWSSSEVDALAAWFQYFSGGGQLSFLKPNTGYVRPVRAFP